MERVERNFISLMFIKASAERHKLAKEFFLCRKLRVAEAKITPMIIKFSKVASGIEK